MKYLKLFENKDINWTFNEEDEFPIPEDFVGFEKFYEFLVENGALEKYIKNFIDQKNMDLNHFLKKTKKEGNEDNFINNAFTWVRTPEGYDFWSHLYGDWSTYRKK